MTEKKKIKNPLWNEPMQRISQFFLRQGEVLHCGDCEKEMQQGEAVNFYRLTTRDGIYLRCEPCRLDYDKLPKKSTYVRSSSKKTNTKSLTRRRAK